MSDAISVECPQCHAKLKLKNRSAIGKRVPCPKCKKPFVVAAPPDDEDSNAFLSVAEPEADEFADLANEGDEPGQSEESERPTRRMKRPGKKGQKKSAPLNWQKPLLIGTSCLLLIGLLGGLGYVGLNFASFFGPKNKIDLAYLPPDSDIIVHLQVPAVWNAPLMQSLVGVPAAKPELDKLQQELGITVDDIQSVTFGRSGFFEHTVPDLTSGKAFQPAVPPQPGAGPAPVVVGSQKTQSITVLRLKKSVDPKDLQGRLKGRLVGPKNHDGRAPYYELDPNPNTHNPLAMHFAAPDVVVVGPAIDIILAIQRGAAVQRRADLDFIDATQPILIAFVPKQPSSFDPPQGSAAPAGRPGMSGAPGMPAMGGPPAGGSRLQELQRGKVKGVCLGVTIGADINWRMSMNCTTAEASSQIAAEMDKSLQETKTQFAQIKALMPPQVADLVQVADTVLNSIATKPSGTQIEVAGQIPGSIKSAIEKLASGGGMPLGFPMPFGSLFGGGANPFGGAAAPSDGPAGNLPADGPASLSGQNPFGGGEVTIPPTPPEETKPMRRSRDSARRATLQFVLHL